MKISELGNAVKQGTFDDSMTMLYGSGRLQQQKERYVRILNEAEKRFGDVEAMIFSAPGRTEIGGNHTDHQLGRVLAASIDLDIMAVVVKSDDNVISYSSDAFQVEPVDLNHLDIRQEEINTTESLIRGIAARFVQLGYHIGGFRAYAESDVLPGSGMSSSAAFEILIASILSSLYNNNAIDPVLAAKIGQYAENVYFGKASGLLDQTACSVGGFVEIDFKDRENPLVKKVDFDFDDSGYVLILTNCRQSHADLSDEYSLVPAEMKQVANVFGKEVLSQITLKQLIDNAAEVRAKCPDRAFLRAYHFLTETDRVLDEAASLEKKDMKKFLQLVNESGRSSFMYLQNVYPPKEVAHQSLPVGLAVSEYLLKEDGAWRVHGGGFAGTIQAFVPVKKADEYVRVLESVFGKDSCYRLRIRPVGGYRVDQ